MFPMLWLDIYLLVVLSDSSYMLCAAVMSIYGIGSFLCRIDGVCVLLYSVSNVGFCVSMYHSYVICLC